jgi:hypothetical protein
MQRQFGTITDLVTVFSDCLCALAPHVTKVGIEWKEGKNYDDWDAIAQALYASTVNSTIAYAVQGQGFSKLPPYGLIMPNYSQLSFLFDRQSGDSFAFLRLEQSDRPFDTAVFLLLVESRPTGKRTRKLLRDCQMAALLRSTTEQRHIVDVIAEEPSASSNQRARDER